MNTSKISPEIQQTFAELSELIQQFRTDAYNQIPFEGSWTAGQVAQHTLMVAGFFADLLYGNVKDAERAPNQLFNDIETRFSNLEAKLQAPEMVTPLPKQYEQNRHQETAQKISEKVTKAEAELDLDKLCTDFELPVWGKLTRQETLFFILHHTKRHVRQLKQIVLLVNYEADAAVITGRIFEVSREKLFAAWTTPDLLKQWWGPKGFTNTFDKYELTAGGKWVFTMHGPDGKNYPNECEFIKIEKPVLLAWFHQSAPHFQTLVTFKELGANKAEVNFKLIFKEVKTADSMRAFIEEKNEENFDKLQLVLNTNGM